MFLYTNKTRCHVQTKLSLLDRIYISRMQCALQKVDNVLVIVYISTSDRNLGIKDRCIGQVGDLDKLY